MADEDLEALARLSASTRQALAAGALGITFAITAGIVLAKLDLSPKAIGGAVVSALIAGAFLGTRVRTPSDAYPSIRLLRTDPQRVGHIVVIDRGKRFVALAGDDGTLLAKPLVLKEPLKVATAINADSIRREKASASGQALAIISARCPRAPTAHIKNMLGMSSLAKLAKKAIERSPS